MKGINLSMKIKR